MRMSFLNWLKSSLVIDLHPARKVAFIAKTFVNLDQWSVLIILLLSVAIFPSQLIFSD